MIKVRSHKRLRKNGASIVKSHMRPGMKKRVKKSLKRAIAPDYATVLHPNTANLRKAISSNTNNYLRSHDLSGIHDSGRKSAKRKSRAITKVSKGSKFTKNTFK